MGVSKNNGTPKSSIFIGFSIINHPFWGPTPIFGNIHMSHSLWGRSVTFYSLRRRNFSATSLPVCRDVRLPGDFSPSAKRAESIWSSWDVHGLIFLGTLIWYSNFCMLFCWSICCAKIVKIWQNINGFVGLAWIVCPFERAQASFLVASSED